MSPNLMVSMPKCRHCGRQWRPAEDVMSTHEFCDLCSEDRRTIAQGLFQPVVLTGAEFVGGYLLPRVLRAG